MRLAEAIKAKRLVECQNSAYGFSQEYATSTFFFEYYRMISKQRIKEDSRGRFIVWDACLKHLQQYEKNHNITFRAITKEWVRGFRDYLEFKTTLSNNSKSIYFSTLRTCFCQAIKDNIISSNPMFGIDGFRYINGTRMYLTTEELRKISETYCKHQDIKNAFLFSCLTGLRYSDIARLKWGDVYKEQGFTRIIFRQKKTSGQEYLDITEQAVFLMGARKNADDFVFQKLMVKSTINKAISELVQKAGINKHITFHCGRHMS
ncbi:MAG: site-specific integrase [Bacteroides sp.]|nr:site-specific integrase [Bacteroides sp.]MCM1403139.1 site-specific integrase [Bacteroides sp.]MCM1442875.1 site-specific integrase [Muribaculum sp.]MCM1576077.1 site-specific integrase [Bacteroides sp.]